MSAESLERHADLLGAIASLAVGVFTFLIVARAVGVDYMPRRAGFIALAAGVTAGPVAAFLLASRKLASRAPLGLLLLAAAGWTLALATLAHLAGYLLLPVDLLSFAESGFITDIIEFRSGQPLYTPPPDNSAIVYTPGAPILTYLIAQLFGGGNSIPFLRLVQFSFVAIAALLAAACFRELCRIALPAGHWRFPLMWTSAAAAFLFLVATDPAANIYVHSLHNDGLALMVSMFSYWLLLRYAAAPRPWLLGLMCVVPAAGFLVKQSLIVWSALFFGYLLFAGIASKRSIFLYAAGCVLAAGVTLGICVSLWGTNFLWWTFQALGAKSPSPWRIGQHFFESGLYFAFMAAGGWVLAFRNGSRSIMGLWLALLLLFPLQLWTSGITWVLNHLGPSVVIATCWILVVLVRIWPQLSAARTARLTTIQQVFAAAVVVAIFGSQGLCRDPRNPVPADFHRYVGELNRELDGPLDDVLMDFGSWPYMRDNIVMKDRALSVAVHAGANQPRIDREMLLDTFRRIENRTYRKILVHNFDTAEDHYDFARRGTGIPKAISANYEVVRRIPGVRGIRQWWPVHLVQDVTVLVPKPRGELAGR